MLRFFRLPLWQQVLIALVLGIAAGFILGPKAASVKFLGTIFINLIKMIIVPLIFFALLSGITSMAGTGNIKRVGLKAMSAYLLTSAFAVVIGITSGLIFQPGVGVTLDLLSNAAKPPTAPANLSIADTLLGIIPDNAIGAMASGNILQVLVFAAFTGVSINLMGSHGARVVTAVTDLAKLFFTMIGVIIRFAPFGVFGYIAWAVGTQGMDVLISLAKLVFAVLAACLFQYLLFGVLITVFGRISPMPFYRKLLEVQLLAFSTSSSKATLPTTMVVLHEKIGVSKSSTNFVLPLGAAINMDGTAIYLGICALFFAQMTGTPLGMHDYLVLILTCTLGSIGAAGIPSGSIIFMGMVLTSVGLPIEGIGIILGVDRILDMVRTTINITGDSAITLIVDSSEKQLDEQKYYE